jgi:hypothetical protein
MAARFVRVYVVCQLIFQLCLLAFALVASTLLSSGTSASYVRYLPIVALLSAVPAFTLAQDKNIWKNEFLRCPMWMRIGCVVLMICGFGAGFSAVVSNQPPFAPAITLFVAPGAMMILFSVIRTGIAGPQADERLRLSLTIAAVLLVGSIAYFAYVIL